MRQPSFFRLAFKQFWLLFGGIWMLVGIPLFGVGAGMAWSEWRYRNEGVTVQGTVEEKYTRHGSKGSTSYYVRYEFTTRDNLHAAGDHQVDRDTWEGLRERDSLTVQYLPDRPDKNRVPGQTSDLWMPLIFGGMGSLFGGVGTFLFFRSLARVRTILRLLREGTRVEGTVVAVEESSVSVNRVRQWEIKYSYRDHMGQEHEAKSDYMSPADADTWHEGDTGAVRFDQAHPGISYWFGREESP